LLLERTLEIVMAKKKASGGETKSDFLRKVLSKNIDLDYRQVNRLWSPAVATRNMTRVVVT
jgi:hypothetical protein